MNMARRSVSLGLSFCLCLSTVASAQPVRERATEEIAPGIRVRGGGVAIDLDAVRCDPPCAVGFEGQEVCRDGSCDAGSRASNPCRHCSWECAEHGE
jgi:hypothetical protein